MENEANWTSNNSPPKDWPSSGSVTFSDYGKVFFFWLEKIAPNVIIAKQDWQDRNGILLPKLFWPTVRKNCSSDWEKLLKFGTEGREFAKILRSLEQFVQKMKGQINFW